MFFFFLRKDGKEPIEQLRDKMERLFLVIGRSLELIERFETSLLKADVDKEDRVWSDIEAAKEKVAQLQERAEEIVHCLEGHLPFAANRASRMLERKVGGSSSRWKVVGKEKEVEEEFSIEECASELEQIFQKLSLRAVEPQDISRLRAA